jgi:hypothetical protein
MSHKADSDLVVKKARSQSSKFVEKDNKSISQSHVKKNDKTDEHLAEALTSSSEATGGDGHYKPPWG